MLPFFPPRKPARNNTAPRKIARPSLPGLEALEDRCTPTCNIISGYVYQDANNNGVFDPGEVPIANSPIQLRNAGGQVVGSTTTSASGYYEFDHDATISTAVTSLTKTVSFQNTTTDFSLSGLLDRFDPALGQLQAIEITHSGSITSEIKVENFSGTSPSTISGTIAGDLTLVAPGVNHKLTLSENAGSYNAAVFDGNIDFAGTSGSSFGSKTATNSATFTLTGSDLTPYIGAGRITITENAKATSSASGGGNIVAQISSTAAATVTVVYKYVPSNCLQQGNYTIIQTQQPDGLLDGKDSRNNVPLANSVGADAIAVVLANADLVNNNFGEIVPPQLSGYVYSDLNNNGVKNAGEEGIAGVTLTLTGTDDLGPVSKSATTDASGFYQFLGLRPGTYTVTETQPANWFDGLDAAGSTGGTAGNDIISNIPLAPAAASLNNNFGELKPAELSGYVYVDANDNGVKEAGEAGIAGVTVTLTGTSDRGDAVNVTQTTDAAGFYRFANLRPGNYTITETHPSGYDDGKDTAGSQGGTAGNDVISNIVLGVGIVGVNNNFGELRPEIADLTITKTVGLPSVKIGQQLTYTLTISNLGEFAAKDVVVKDTLPLDATFVSASGAGWTISHAGGIVTATRAALAVNVPTTITVTIVVPAVSNTLVNEATVTASTPDSNPLNNKAVVTTPVSTSPPPIAPLATRVAAVPTTSKKQLLSVGGGQTSTTVRQQMAFLDGLYKTLMGRSPTKAELSADLNRLNRGVSRTVVVQRVWNGAGHYAYVAKQLYNSYLHRLPSAVESAAVVQQLRGGASEAQIVEQLVTSAEYQAQFNTPNKLVGGLYLDLTGKLPDLSANQSLVQSLNNQPLLQAVQGMMATQDALRFSVDHVYRTVLRRAAKAGEMQFGALQLQTGATTQARLAIQLLSSNAFYKLAWRSVK